MGLISLGVEVSRPDREPERRQLTIADFQSIGLVGPPTTTGVSVTQHTANSVAAYWNGVCVIAGDIGVMDRHLYRKVGSDDDRERADEDPLAKLVREPNPYTDACEFWETITSHAVSWGNGFAEIEFDNALRPKALHNLTPDRVDVKVETLVERGRKRSVVYYLVDGKERLEGEDILHIKGLGFDGLRGYSPVYLFRQSLGLSIAAERFGGSFFGNNALPGIAVEHPSKMSDDSKDKIGAFFRQQYGGPDRAHGVLILDQGLKVSKPFTIPPDDAQFLETRGFQIEECARILNLPPHKIKHKVNERPGGNFEASELDYQTTTLLPWTTRIEQELNRKLIVPSRRSVLYFEHNYAKRLKTDTATRMQTYKTLSELKVITPELIAQKENLPKPPEPDPDPSAPPAPPAEDPDEGRQIGGAILAAHRALLMDAATRYIKIEAERAKRGAKKSAEDFEAWLLARREEDRETLRATLLPALRVVVAHRGAGSAEDLADDLAAGHVDASREALLALPARGLSDHVERLVSGWDIARALELAERALEGGTQ